MSSTIEDCKRFFDEADVNKDGFLQYNELVIMLRKKGFTGTDDQIKGMFEAADSSGDDKISLDEYLAVMGKIPQEVTRGALMRQVFRAFDKDNNGVIDREELKEVHKEMGRHLSEEEVEKSMKMLDKNQDGKIDYEEFISFFFKEKDECKN